MTHLGFLFGKLRGDDTLLERLSTPTEILMSEVYGKSIALVGNARSLSETSCGPAIDGSDLVIRMNGAPLPAASSHGRRTDWLAVSTPPDRALLVERKPRRILWMTRKRKRLPFWLVRQSGFYLNRKPDVQRLATSLAAPPTTGLMLIDLLARSSAQSITLYGFDFFASLSLSGRRTADAVPHDFAAERNFVHALIARDPRFNLFPVSGRP